MYSEDAVLFGGVRCTFWSLGESLKPGGSINNFAAAAFCYHLFCQPTGHPDISKRRCFFSNIFVSACAFTSIFHIPFSLIPIHLLMFSFVLGEPFERFRSCI